MFVEILSKIQISYEILETTGWNKVHNNIVILRKK